MKTCSAIVAFWMLLSIACGCAGRYDVEYWAENQPQTLKPVQSASKTQPPSPIYTLDTLPLVSRGPATLRLGGQTYALQDEGLYRIRDRHSSKVVGQSIVYDHDVWRFAGHLSRLYVYGARHQDETQAQWDTRARAGEPLSLQCGFISMFVQHHLAEQGIASRLVGCTASKDWKHYDDGHALMEICDPTERRWIVFDPTLGARFQAGGHWLDLLELTRLYRAGHPPERIDFLNADSKIDPLTDYDTLYARYIPNKSQRDAFLPEFTPLLENDVAMINHWYGRVMQVPLIGNDFAPNSDAEDALLRTEPTWKNLVRWTPEQFREQFYSPACCDPPNTAP